MKRLLFLFIFLFYINCGTTQIKEVQNRIIPSDEIGCTQYKGKQRVDCIGELLKNLEDIKNSKPIVSIISKTRISETIVVVRHKYCWGTSLCFETDEEVYDPTFLGKVKTFLLTFGGGIIVGLLTGVYIQ